MKRILLCAVMFFTSAFAQDVRTVVVVPFQGTEGTGPFAIGMAASLQRALNVLDGIYVPPIGDSVLVAERAAAADRDPVTLLRTLFDANDLLEGRLRLRDASLVLELRLGDAQRDVPLTSADPARSAALVAGAAVELLGLTPSSADRREMERVLEQTPSLPSLGAVSVGSSGLPLRDTGGIRTAVDLDGGSSWVRAEYARALALEGATSQAVAEAERAVEIAASDIEAWVVLGVVRDAAGDREGALAAFESAQRINPAHALAAAGIGRTTTDASRAATALERAIDAYPRLVEAYVSLADRASNLQRSLQALRRAQPYLPDAVGIHRRIVDRLVAAGEAGSAVSYLQETAGAPLAASPALYALAARLPADRSDDALALVERGLEAFPESVELAAAKGDILLDQGRPQEVVDLLAPLVEGGVRRADVLNTLAVAHARLGDVESARALFEDIAGNPEARFNLALLLLEAGRSGEAEPMLAELTRVEGASADVFAYHGVALANLGRLDEARSRLERALELDPELEVAQRALAQLEQRRDVNVAEVELTQEQAAAVDRGLLALDEGDWPGAIQAFSEARELGDNGVLAFYHAFALQRNGNVRQAVEAYRVAAEGLPQSSVVASNLGYAHLQLGRFDRGLEEIRRALELDATNARAHLNLGLAYYGLGRYGDALAAWEEAEEIAPGITDEVASLRDEAARRVP